jgi:hypothetical protein
MKYDVDALTGTLYGVEIPLIAPLRAIFSQGTYLPWSMVYFKWDTRTNQHINVLC